MTTYERWDLALSTLGQILVAASILYAARQWSVSQKTLQREVKRDTRDYISDLARQLHRFQEEIIDRDLNANEFDLSSGRYRPVLQLLNTLEAAGQELVGDFYDRVMLEAYLGARANFAWITWGKCVLAV